MDAVDCRTRGPGARTRVVGGFRLGGRGGGGDHRCRALGSMC